MLTVIVKFLGKKPASLARFFLIFWHFTVLSIEPRAEKPEKIYFFFIFHFKKKEEFFSFQFPFSRVPEHQVFLKTA